MRYAVAGHQLRSSGIRMAPTFAARIISRPTPGSTARRNRAPASIRSRVAITYGSSKMRPNAGSAAWTGRTPRTAAAMHDRAIGASKAAARTRSPLFTLMSRTRPGALAATSISPASMRPLLLARNLAAAPASGIARQGRLHHHRGDGRDADPPAVFRFAHPLLACRTMMPTFVRMTNGQGRGVNSGALGGCATAPIYAPRGGDNRGAPTACSRRSRIPAPCAALRPSGSRECAVRPRHVA